VARAQAICAFAARGEIARARRAATGISRYRIDISLPRTAML
jgi:hypothetical protein